MGVGWVLFARKLTPTPTVPLSGGGRAPL